MQIVLRASITYTSRYVHYVSFKLVNAYRAKLPVSVHTMCNMIWPLGWEKVTLLFSRKKSSPLTPYQPYEDGFRDV